MKNKLKLFLIMLTLLFTSSIYADTTVPMKLNVSAVLSSGGNLINTVSTQDVKIGLYTDASTFVWQKTYSLMITNGLVEATLQGAGTNSNNDSVSLNESLFENENLQVGFTIQHEGQDTTVLVDLTSQPFAIKSAIADHANESDSTLAIKGYQIDITNLANGKLMVFQDGKWIVKSITADMFNLTDYQIPAPDVNEITGTIGNMKVNRILGKRLESSLNNADKIPTGAILMYSPDVDALNGSFHPSSGNPDEGEVLTWDSSNGVWMPSANLLVKLDDVVEPNPETSTQNFMVYDKAINKFKVTTLGVNYLKDISISSPSDRQLLVYNGLSEKWVNQSLSITELSDVNSQMSASSGQFLNYDGSKWQSKSVKLSELADISGGFQADKVLISGSVGAQFSYIDFKLNALKDVNSTSLSSGQTLVWNGTQWTGAKNKIESINELAAFDISTNPANKFMYHDGSTWVDKSLTFVENINDLGDVNIGTTADGEFLRWNSNSSRWVNEAIDLNDIQDFNVSFQNQNALNPVKRFLVFKEGAWVNDSISIEEMSNVAISNGATNELLMFNGSSWVNSTIGLNSVNDVTLAGKAANDILVYNGTNWENGSIGIDVLNNVSITNPAAKQMLLFNGTNWSNGSLKIEDAANVTLTDVSNDQVLVYDSSNSQWINQDQTSQMDRLNDVSLTNLANGEFLIYNATSSNWENGTVNLDALSNVAATSRADNTAIQDGDILAYNGTSWVIRENLINNIADVNVSNDPTGKYLYFDGTNWVDKDLANDVLSSLNKDYGITWFDNNSSIEIDEETGHNYLTLSSNSGYEKGIALLSTDTKDNWWMYSGSGNDEGKMKFHFFNFDDSTSSIIPLVLTKAGNVGIGTSSPTNKLSIPFRIDSQAPVDNDNKVDMMGALIWRQPSGWEGTAMGSKDYVDAGSSTDRYNIMFSDTGALWLNSDNKIVFEQGKGNEVMRITGKKVGLGVTAPDAKLHVKRSGSESALRVSATEAGKYLELDYNQVAAHGEPLYLNYASNSNVILAQGGGNVGIGTTTPGEALDVSGNMKISGDIDAGGKVLFSNVYPTEADLPDAATYHGMFAHVHATGKAYFSHSGSWHALQTESSASSELSSNSLNIDGQARATSMFLGASDATPTTNADVKLHVDGDAQVDGAIYISGGADLAEGFHIVASEKVEPGTVVSIDPNNIGKLVVTNEANDTKVAGVVSGGNGIKAGLIMTQTGTLADGEYPIALTGRVWVKCTNENGTIGVGDLLTTAATAGHAMKADGSKSQGAILGKAMSPCTEKGMVLTLISLQ